MRRLGALLVAGVIAAGCGGDSRSHDLEVTRASLGDKWPFTVESGTLHCDGSNGTGEVTFVTGGKTYGVNGLARQNPAYADVFDIWADDPSVSGLKKDMKELTTYGLSLC